MTKLCTEAVFVARPISRIKIETLGVFAVLSSSLFEL